MNNWKLIAKLISETVHPDFQRLFLLKEGKELLGKKQKNFWVLCIILFSTFLTIGFANGSLEYLQKKMSDPFVNWVSIQVPMGKKDKLKTIIRELQSQKIKNEYVLDTITGYFTYYSQLVDNKKANTKLFMGRSISANSPIRKQIFNDKNYIAGKKKYGEKDIGFIVTEDLMNELGYSLKSPFINMSIATKDTIFIVPIPIISVVKELPGLSDFAFTPYFYFQRIFSVSNPFRIDQYTSNLNIFIDYEIKGDTLAQLKLLDDTIYEVLDRLPLLSDFNSKGSSKIDTSTMLDGINLEITFFPNNPSLTQIDSMFHQISSIKFYKSLSLWRNYAYSFRSVSTRDAERFDYLSVYFKNLDNIRKFKEYLKNTYDMEIDMSLIEAKENYNFITRLTRILSVILIGFSIFALSLFTSNVFVRHIEKIGMNLGTFKAFGLSNRVLKRIYLILIFALLCSAIVISLISAWILGELGIINMVLSILNYRLEGNQDFFTLGSYWTLLVIAIIIAVLFIFLNNITNKQLLKTPGDLIYGRD